MRDFTRRSVFGLAAGAAAAAALSACSSSSSTATTATSTAVTQAEIDKAMTTPTTLTFWTWVPDISQEVAVFEKKYPAVKVNVVNAGPMGLLYRADIFTSPRRPSSATRSCCRPSRTS